MNGHRNAASVQPYLLLRAALTLFKSPPARLDGAQLSRAESQAAREYELEARVLHSREASRVVVTQQQIEDAYREIRKRYADEDEFIADLQQNRLDADLLIQALQRECRVNATLELIGSRAPSISDVEVGIYYHAHPEKFAKPEQREVRQILVTINDAYPENSRANATAKMSQIAAKLYKKPHKLAELALQYSECPSALQGGALGAVSRGVLYPELDEALFRMREGQLSGIIETEIGLHIISCMHIHRAETVALKKAAPKIRALLEERSRRVCQRAWIAGLPKSSAKEPSHDRTT